MKKGQNLASTLNVHKNNDPDIEKPKDICYDSVDTLLQRKTEKTLKELTPAMKEYISSKYFSPDLEKKKYENIEKFFIVFTIQEKYQIINSIFQDNKTKPVFTTNSKTDERKTGESPDRVKEKEKNGDLIDLRIRIIDETIKKNVDDEINREMKRHKNDGIGIILKQKKKKTRGLSLTDKFYTLNMKSRFVLENLTKMMNQNRTFNNKNPMSNHSDMKFSLTSRKYEHSVNSPASSSKFKFPALKK